MENNRSYYAIVPANVRYDKGLTPNAKLLYAEITALCNEQGFCWASNKYFADLYEVTNRTVTSWITLLEEKGYINRQVIFKEGTSIVEERRIYLAEPTFFNKAISKEKKKTEEKIKKEPKDSNENMLTDFEKLWKLYPNKKGKSKALKEYCKAIKKGTTNKEIQNGIVSYKNYLKTVDWLNPAHGSSWFAQERWLDENEKAGTNTPVGKTYKSVDEVLKGLE